MSDKDSGKGRVALGLGGLVGLACVLGSAALAASAFSPGDLLPLGILLVFALIFEFLSPPAHYGYVTLAFFVYFAAAARPDPPGGLVAAGQACLVATVALLVRSMTGGLSGSQKAAYLVTNLARVGLVVFAYALIRGKDGLVGPLGLVAVAAAMGVYVVLDWSLATPVVRATETEDAGPWLTGLKDHWWLMLGFVADGVLTAGFVQLAAPALKPEGALLVGLLFGGVLAMVLRAAIIKAFDEIIVQDQDKLVQQINAERFRADNLFKQKKQLEDDLDKKSEENNLVYEMAQALGATTNLSETLDVVQTMIKRLHIPFQSCVIFLVKSDGKETLVPAKSDTPYKDVLHMSSLLQLEESIIKKAVQSRKPQIDVELPASTEQRIFKDERSVIAVPLVVSKEVIGVLYVGSQKPGVHNDAHYNKLKMLAVYAAPSLKTALLFEDKDKQLLSEQRAKESEQARVRQLQGIQDIATELNRSATKVETLVESLANGLQKMVPEAQSVIVFTNGDKEEQQLKAEFALSPYAQYVETLPVRKDEGIFAKVFANKDAVLVTDTQNNYGLHNIIAYERSVIVAPLVYESDILGCIYVGAKDEEMLSDEHRNLVKTVSLQAASNLKNARLLHEKEMQSLTDGLTGLYTHRYFQTRLQDEIDWSERHNRPMCLVMVDTDHFKSYNDTLGHPAGDALLKEIASLLKEKVRTTDIVCRYGGDEFALILKETTKDDALKTCERVREAFQLRFSSHKVRITSSIGMACFPLDALNKKELAEAADEALYVSKRSGRNRVNAAPTVEERAKQGQKKITQEPLPRS
ncbi:MAG: diguanylate cyclase [Candidatus Eremiobacterota bacterium]